MYTKNHLQMQLKSSKANSCFSTNKFTYTHPFIHSLLISAQLNHITLVQTQTISQFKNCLMDTRAYTYHFFFGDFIFATNLYPNWMFCRSPTIPLSRTAFKINVNVLSGTLQLHKANLPKISARRRILNQLCFDVFARIRGKFSMVFNSKMALFAQHNLSYFRCTFVDNWWVLEHGFYVVYQTVKWPLYMYRVSELH